MKEMFVDVYSEKTFIATTDLTPVYRDAFEGQLRDGLNVRVFGNSLSDINSCLAFLSCGVKKYTKLSEIAEILEEIRPEVIDIMYITDSPSNTIRYAHEKVYYNNGNICFVDNRQLMADYKECSFILLEDIRGLTNPVGANSSPPKFVTFPHHFKVKDSHTSSRELWPFNICLGMVKEREFLAQALNNRNSILSQYSTKYTPEHKRLYFDFVENLAHQTKVDKPFMAYLCESNSGNLWLYIPDLEPNKEETTDWIPVPITLGQAESFFVPGAFLRWTWESLPTRLAT